MFKHLLKLIWNKKKQNALLITEIFFSFIVMFAVFSLMVYSYNNYRKPMGFQYNNVWVVNFSHPENLKSKDSIMTFLETLRKQLVAMPEIENLSYTSSNVPFSMNTSNSNIGYNGKKAELANMYQAEDSYKDVMNVQMASGRWFSKADQGLRYTPVVINSKLKESFFGNEVAEGKIIGEMDDAKANANNRFMITGVMENIKEKGSYQSIENGMYMRMDSGSYSWTGAMLVKVKDGTGAAFESRLFKTVSNTTGTNVEIEHLEKKLVSKNYTMLVPMIIAAIVAGFLIINVALGLFGVLWYNINKRRGEIGLRRAVGATGNAVSRQLLGEALVLSSFALIIGTFFAVQFPLMNIFDLSASIYLAAIGLSLGFIYLLVIICAVYPGRQAAAIYPAVALHEE